MCGQWIEDWIAEDRNKLNHRRLDRYKLNHADQVFEYPNGEALVSSEEAFIVELM
jgi:hypothetical protein